MHWRKFIYFLHFVPDMEFKKLRKLCVLVFVVMQASAKIQCCGIFRELCGSKHLGLSAYETGDNSK